MITTPTAGQVVQVHGSVALLPPGIASAAANDAAPDFIGLLESALYPVIDADPPADGDKIPKARPKRAAAPEALDLVALGQIASLAQTTGLRDSAASSRATDKDPAIRGRLNGPAPHAAPAAAAAQDRADRVQDAPQAGTKPALPVAATAPTALGAKVHDPQFAQDAETLELAQAPESGPVTGQAAAPQDAKPTPHPAALHVSPRPGSPGFDEAFAARVTLAVRAGHESVSIELNPPELGPVEMRIRVSDGEAHVVFAAEQAPTREAISEALPRLREMLSVHGLELTGGSVGAELPQRDASSPGRAPGEDAETLAKDAAGENELLLAHVPEPRLVDTFA